MSLMMIPILPGKVEDWKTWSKEVTDSRRQEFEDLNRRYGLTRHNAWLAETDGGNFALVMHEGPGVADFMKRLAESDQHFDKWFRSKVSEIHGADFSKKPDLRPLKKFIDSGQ